MSGKTIARYELHSEIGRGGMAVVYLAHDPNFRRNVAVKLVSVNLQDNPVFRERFEREARLIAGIEHPAIVPVYDFGEQDGQLYLVMRHMAGGPLSNKIKEGRLSLGYAAGILSQIAPALDAVHARGIVHRDLKPGNILLDGFGHPAISDFGIAHLTAATSDLTGSAVIGTPTYMSPEQVRGDDDLDGRSDVYALGVILFEMLTGRGPFHAATPLSAALKHLTDPIPSLRAARADLPVEVEQILNKALAKDRDDRYARATDLARALEAAVDALPASVVNDTGPAPRGEAATEVDLANEAAVPAAVVFPSEGAASTPGIPPMSTPARTGTSAVRKTSPPPWRVFALLGGGALGLLLLCSALGVFGTWAGLKGFFPAPTLTALPTSTAAPAPDPTEPVQAPPVILYSDDFSDPQSGWPNMETTQGAYSYRTDGYHIIVEENGAVLWAKTGRSDGDARLQVDARPLGEGVMGYYGLLCRIQDAGDFYYFVVHTRGSFNIGKYKGGAFQPLYSGNWQASEAILPGNQANRLAADCSGSRLRLTVNGALLGEVTDADFTSGFSGIVAAALDERGAEVLFNDFLIAQPVP